MMQDDDDDNDDPMILNNRAKNNTSERTIVPWTVIFYTVYTNTLPLTFSSGSWPEKIFCNIERNYQTLEPPQIQPIQNGVPQKFQPIGKRFLCFHCLMSTVHSQIQFLPDRFTWFIRSITRVNALLDKMHHNACKVANEGAN